LQAISMTRLLSILFALLAVLAPTPRAAERPSRAEAEAVEAGTNLPVVLLEAKEAIVSDRKVPCTAQIILPPGATGGTGSAAGRGAHSRRDFAGLRKKVIRADPRCARAQHLGMRTSRHWILNASAVDRSLMRHKLSTICSAHFRRRMRLSRHGQPFRGGQTQREI
jgi:hypothetical protein